MPEFFEDSDPPEFKFPAQRIETRRILERLRQCPIGGEVTYSELAELTGEDFSTFGGRGRRWLYRAVERLRNESIVFVPNPGVGVTRTDDIGKVGESTRHLGKSRRAARRSARLALAVDDFNAMPNEKKIEHNRNLSIAGVINQFTRAPAMKKLSAAVANAQAALPVLGSLEAFKGS